MIEHLLTLPWTVVRSERDDDGTYSVLTIEELPGFVVAGETDEELDQAYYPALTEFLRSYLEEGELPPLPEGVEFEPSEKPNLVVIEEGAVTDDYPTAQGVRSAMRRPEPVGV